MAINWRSRLFAAILIATAASAVLASTASGAAELPVSVTVRAVAPGAGAKCEAARLSARRIDCDPRPETRCAWDSAARIPGESELSLPVGLYQFSIEGGSCFVAPRVEAVSGPRADVELRAFLPATVSGGLLVDRGVRLPAAVEVTAQYPGVPELSAVAARCPVNGQGQWQCRLARGSPDLRLQAPGFASIFYWGADATREANQVEARRLAPGSSVVGRVETADRLPAAPAEALLKYAAGSGASAQSRERSALTGRAVPIDKRGWFQFQAVESGVYELVVSKQGYSSVTVAPLTVSRSGEVELQDAIRLARPIRFSIQIEPAADPYGAPWNLTLLEPTTDPVVWRNVAVRRVDRAGAAVFSGLAPGRFKCSIGLGGQAVFSTTELAVSEDGEAVQIEVPVVSVLGTVALGKEPLAADLAFIGKGISRIPFASGPDGRFTGYLPRSGRYNVAVSAPDRRLRREVKGIEVRADPASGAADVEIVLPTKRLAGRVSDEGGQPVPGAVVFLVGSNRQMDSVKTDADGAFEFQALPAGRLLLWAEAAGVQSETRSVTLPAEADGLEDVELVLRAPAILRGRVTQSGDAVPGASVLAFARRAGDLPMSMLPAVPSATSDLDGSFTLDLPRDTHQVDLVVLSPGRALAVRSVPLPAEGEALVELSPEAGALELLGLENLDLDDPGAALPVLLHRGAVLDQTLLTLWRRLNSNPASAGAGATIPSLEPGTYLACALTPAEVFAVLSGLAAVRVETCSRSEVRAGEVSQVRLPEPAGRKP